MSERLGGEATVGCAVVGRSGRGAGRHCVESSEQNTSERTVLPVEPSFPPHKGFTILEIHRGRYLMPPRDPPVLAK